MSSQKMKWNRWGGSAVSCQGCGETVGEDRCGHLDSTELHYGTFSDAPDTHRRTHRWKPPTPRCPPHPKPPTHPHACMQERTHPRWHAGRMQTQDDRHPPHPNVHDSPTRTQTHASLSFSASEEHISNKRGPNLKEMVGPISFPSAVWLKTTSIITSIPRL